MLESEVWANAIAGDTEAVFKACVESLINGGISSDDFQRWCSVYASNVPCSEILKSHKQISDLVETSGTDSLPLSVFGLDNCIFMHGRGVVQGFSYLLCSDADRALFPEIKYSINRSLAYIGCALLGLQRYKEAFVFFADAYQRGLEGAKLGLGVALMGEEAEEPLPNNRAEIMYESLYTLRQSDFPHDPAIYNTVFGPAVSALEYCYINARGTEKNLLAALSCVFAMKQRDPDSEWVKRELARFRRKTDGSYEYTYS